MGAGLVTEGRGRRVQPICLVELKTLEEFQSFPCYDDLKKMDLLQESESVDFSISFVVFVSHLWIRKELESPLGEEEGFYSCPDNEDNDAFQLCVKGIRQLYDESAHLLSHCFVWVDYCCIDHIEWMNSPKYLTRLRNHTPLTKKQGWGALVSRRKVYEVTEPSHNGIDVNAPELSYELVQLDAIMRCCDCLFTPIVSPSTWQSLSGCVGYILNEKILGWNKSPQCYMNRAWCRLELFLSAGIPLSKATKSKRRWLGGSIGKAVASNRRPHVLFGPSLSSLHFEYKFQLAPQCLPPFQVSLVDSLHPLQGAVSNPADWPLIKFMFNQLMDYMPRASRGKLGRAGISLSSKGSMSGKRNVLGRVTDPRGVILYKNGDRYHGSIRNGIMQGFGVYTYFEGDVYEGNFHKNEMSGRGVYTHADGERYDGEWQHGMKHGQGTFHYANGDVYSGQWKHNTIHGQGRYQYNTGDVYEGNRINGIISGYGSLTCTNGDSYTGEYLSGKKHGQGTFTYADGSVYSGRWVSNVIHGFGRFDSKQGWSYKGMWENNLPSGDGILVSANGDEYRGSLRNGQREGKGRLDYANGNYYTGPFKNDMCEGHGTLVVIANNTSNRVGYSYHGNFKANKFSGDGRLVFEDGEVFVGQFSEGQRLFGHCKLADGSSYDGNYRDNKRHGKGVYQGPSSCSEDKQGTSGLHDKYDGEWRDGKRDGYGTFWYKTGSSYEGTWREGRKHGQGVYVLHNGDIYKGHFENNKFNGFGVLKTHEGEMYEGYWSQGRRHGEGQYLYKNGDLYNGEWSHNRRHRGRLEYHNGEVYEGTFDEFGRMAGAGRYTYMSGAGYDGVWKRGERSGKGQFTSKEKEIIKTALWHRDFVHRTIKVTYEHKKNKDDQAKGATKWNSDT